MCLCNLVSCFGLDLSGGKLNFPALLDIAIHHTLRHSTTLPGGLNAQLHPVLILIIYVIQLHSLFTRAHRMQSTFNVPRGLWVYDECCLSLLVMPCTYTTLHSLNPTVLVLTLRAARCEKLKSHPLTRDVW